MGASEETGERFEFLQPPDLPGVTVAFVEDSTRTVRMVHETYTSAIVLRGPRTWECNGERFTTAPGMTLAWRPGDVHACLAATRTTQRGMLVPPDQMRAVAREAGIEGDLDVKVRQNSDRALFAAHDRFYRSIEGHATRLERQTLFLAALKKLLTSSFGARPARSAAAAGKSARAKANLDANFERPIDLAELAEVSGLGRFQLIRAFKADYGCAPHAYQIDRRLARARELLARGAAPAQVALYVGFADQSHLTRHFKRIFGATPGRWAGRA